jgi:hypothetical protein
MPKGAAAKKITMLVCQLGHPLCQSTTFGMRQWGTR